MQLTVVLSWRWDCLLEQASRQNFVVQQINWRSVCLLASFCLLEPNFFCCCCCSFGTTTVFLTPATIGESQIKYLHSIFIWLRETAAGAIVERKQKRSVVSRLPMGPHLVTLPHTTHSSVCLLLSGRALDSFGCAFSLFVCLSFCGGH